MTPPNDPPPPPLSLQARCKGWVGRQRYKQMQVQDSAALVIQQNVLSYLEVRDWSWWKLYLKVSETTPLNHTHPP